MRTIHYETTKPMEPNIGKLAVRIVAHGDTLAEVKGDAERQAREQGASVEELRSATVYNTREDWEAIFGPCDDPAIRFGDDFVTGPTGPTGPTGVTGTPIIGDRVAFSIISIAWLLVACLIAWLIYGVVSAYTS